MSGPIFIVGPMGSGTTLMRLVLDSHEHIGIPPETGFMRGYKALRFTPFKNSRASASNSSPLQPSRAVQSRPECLKGVKRSAW